MITIDGKLADRLAKRDGYVAISLREMISRVARGANRCRRTDKTWRCPTRDLP
jgi:hypothetical protein